MKDLTYSKIKSFKEKLIKFNNNLIKKIKKYFDDYYEKHKIKTVKNFKYLSDDLVYEDIIFCLMGLSILILNPVNLNSYEAKTYVRLDLMKLNLMRLIILILNPIKLCLVKLAI